MTAVCAPGAPRWLQIELPFGRKLRLAGELSFLIYKSVYITKQVTASRGAARLA